MTFSLKKPTTITLQTQGENKVPALDHQNRFPIWSPSAERIQNSNLVKFMKKVGCQSYDDLYSYSIHHTDQFWKNIWEFCDVQAQTQGDKVLVNKNDIEKARFFPDAILNFSENLLRRRDSSIAIEFFGEDRVHSTLSWAELYQKVAQLSHIFKQWGLKPGDRIAGYLPNLPQAIIAMLAAASIGAVWSSCSPDFGTTGVIDRFGQIAPRIFLLADGYFYGGKTFSSLDKIDAILKGIPSIEKVIVIPYTQSPDDLKKTSVSWLLWDDVLEQSSARDVFFQPLPFNHPLYILYSSGTTGVPKCIVHGAGGTLLQHLKEHQLHCDLKPNDVFFYFTTCGWMMWNWLVSGLASQAKLVLYDGSPVYPNPTRLFDIADDIGITIFGTSAKYLDNLLKLGISIKNTHNLSSLKMITSTGSPLSPESFEYVYDHIKSDLCLASISGGTDIVSCFALGNPIAPVWKGELQTPGLGMHVEVFDEWGKPIQEQKGELVCSAPFPCQPLGFWNDPDGQKYHQAYYEQFPNVWHHGDFVERTNHHGFIIHGRSDAVLNPGGIRIGTAEIYRQVERINEVLESLVVGQNWNKDVRVILFVRLKDDIALTEDLCQRIKQHIRKNTTPRHVPAKVIQIPDIPRTKNGKLAELAVRQIIHGEFVKNKEALANPESLKYYERLEILNQD